MMNTTEVTGKH